jgi:C4-dicarboxylate-specific signal transduction histidine kinase
MLLDEVLTMSARIAVATGSREWAYRYRKAERELEQALELARSITPPHLQAELKRTDAANARLVQLETEALELVGQGRVPEAHERIFSGNYERLKVEYSMGMQRTLEGIQEHTKADSRRVTLWTDLATVAATLGIALSFILMVVDSRRERREYLLREELAVLSRRNAVERLAIGITHEISQPLSAIGHYLDGALTLLAAQESGSSGQVKEAILGARQQAARAGLIVRQMRDFAGRGVNTRENLELGALIREIEVLIRPHSKQEGVELVIEWLEGEVWVEGDRLSVQLVLVNLILNAVQACADVSGAKRVTLSAAVHDGSTRMTVRDTGKGVDPEESESIFEAFYSSKPGGLGLGLPISRDIVEAHGGNLVIKPSEHGACFVVELPRISNESA